MKLGISLGTELVDANWFVGGIVGRKCFFGRGGVKWGEPGSAGAFLVGDWKSGGLRHCYFLTTQSPVQVELQKVWIASHSLFSGVSLGIIVHCKKPLGEKQFI